jgi:hypothetical protein
MKILISYKVQIHLIYLKIPERLVVGLPTNIFSLRGMLQKAPASPEVMHCFDDRYREGKNGSPTA